MAKKLLAALCAACMLLAVFTGCNKREEASAAESVEESASQEDGVNPSEVSLVQLDPAKAGDTVAVIKVGGAVEGTIRVKLFPEYAPKTVAGFVELAEKGFYNGIVFNTVIENLMIQTGEPTADSEPTESAGEESAADGEPVAAEAEPVAAEAESAGEESEGAESAPESSEREGMQGGTFEDEFHMSLRNFRGALTMDNKTSDGSEFAIVQAGTDLVPETLVEQMKGTDLFPDEIIAKYQEVGGIPNRDWRDTVFGQVVEGMDIVDAIAAVSTDENDKPENTIMIESITIEK